MKDLQKHLKKLRTDAAECKLISDLATDLEKRELFARLTDHLSVLASEVERAISAKVSQHGDGAIKTVARCSRIGSGFTTAALM
ncbi:hypothetical protein LMTR13_26160 [Bradyrhizobium icense]|uniref:Uncharacterized protein n=1 Tax=Bradyrhizobium icense TaxID=1274631 RepID=A0A1B1UK72_9BRAD|nr:hypothetical protein LMTR13_26160 [Bradyrhizobium icense]